MNTEYNRQSPRLPGHDYASRAYFVTVCLQAREALLRDERYELTPLGRMVLRVWGEMPGRFPGIELDEFAVAPDHVHGILVLKPAVQSIPSVLPSIRVARAGTRPAPTLDRAEGAPITLGRVMGAFKSITTVEAIRGVRDHGWPGFYRRFWQRNYFDVILRDDSWDKVRSYIDRHNYPKGWDGHPNNRSNVGAGLVPAHTDGWDVGIPGTEHP
jgi:putative transposase